METNFRVKDSQLCLGFRASSTIISEEVAAEVLMGKCAAIVRDSGRGIFPRFLHARVVAILAILPLFICFPFSFARADELPGDTVLTLDQMLDQMREHNPQLTQAKANYLAAKAAIPQALAFEGPTINLAESQMPRHPLNVNKAQSFNYGLTQSFLFPGKRELAGEVAKADAEVAKTGIDSALLDLTSQVKANFYSLLVLEKQLQINQNNIERLEGIKKIAKIRYANNAAAYVDYLNAQVEQSSAENEQFALQRQIESVRQTLNTLIGREPLTPLAVKGELPGGSLPRTKIEDLEKIAMENNPAVKSSAMQVKSAQKSLDLARAAYLPDFDVAVSNDSDNPPYGLSGNSYGLELDLILPSWLLIKEKAGVDQAKANLKSTQAGDKYNQLSVKLTVDGAYNSLSTAVKQTDFIRSRQLEQARVAYKLGLTNYSNSTMDFTDLLEAQSNLHETELALAQSELEAAQSYIELISVVGKEID